MDNRLIKAQIHSMIYQVKQCLENKQNQISNEDTDVFCLPDLFLISDQSQR